MDDERDDDLDAWGDRLDRARDVRREDERDLARGRRPAALSRVMQEWDEEAARMGMVGEQLGFW